MLNILKNYWESTFNCNLTYKTKHVTHSWHILFYYHASAASFEILKALVDEMQRIALNYYLQRWNAKIAT